MPLQKVTATRPSVTGTNGPLNAGHPTIRFRRRCEATRVLLHAVFLAPLNAGSARDGTRGPRVGRVCGYVPETQLLGDQCFHNFLTSSNNVNTPLNLKQ